MENLLDSRAQREVIGGENHPTGRPLQVVCLRDQYRGLFYIFNNNLCVGIQYNISKFAENTSGSTAIQKKFYIQEEWAAGISKSSVKKNAKFYT